MTTPKRVLLIDDDALVLGVAGDLLHAGGFAVQLLMYPTLAVKTAQDFKPDIVVLDLHMPVLHGREVVRSLRAFPETRHLPVVFLTSRYTVADELRCFALGGVDLWRKPFDPDHVDRLHLVFSHLAELGLSKNLSPRDQLRRHYLAWRRREGSSGSLVVNPVTPFEGRAVFDQGQLTWARLGPLNGDPALDEVLSIDDGIWRWEEGVIAPPASETVAASQPSPQAAYKPKVLLVDDELDLRRLASRQLANAGFRVDVAEHGEQGQKMAAATEYDAVVADLNMPVLDGWGMLRLLKADVCTRETPLLFLSAHDDYRETLKAARAGALDYLRKTGHADELVKKVRALCVPRLQVRQALAGGRPIDKTEISTVGPVWLLRLLSELDCTATVKAQEAWGTWTIRVDRGQLIEAVGQSGTRKVTGMQALSAFLVSRGAQASIQHEAPADQDPSPPWLAEVLDDAIKHVRTLEKRVVDDRLARTTKYAVDPELGALFQQVGADREVRLLLALQEGVTPGGLAEHVGLEPEEAVEALKELVRRGVVKPA